MRLHSYRHFWPQFILLLLVSAFSSCIGIPSGDNADEARNVRTLLVQRYPFVPRRKPSSFSSQADGIEVYWSPLSYRSNLFVYGVLEAQQQNRIVSIVNEIRSTNHLHPVLIIFYSNFSQDDRPHQGIRKVMIRDPKPYDEKPEDY